MNRPLAKQRACSQAILDLSLTGSDSLFCSDVRLLLCSEQWMVFSFCKRFGLRDFLAKEFFRLSFIFAGLRGPCLESPDNFSGPKAELKSKPVE